MFHSKTRVALFFLTFATFAAGQTLGAVSPERLKDLTAGWEIETRPMITNSHNLYNPCVLPQIRT